MKLPATHPYLIPQGDFWNISESKSTKVNNVCSNNKHQLRFQGIVYFKWKKWRSKILRNINK